MLLPILFSPNAARETIIASEFHFIFSFSDVNPESSTIGGQSLVTFPSLFMIFEVDSSLGWFFLQMEMIQIVQEILAVAVACFGWVWMHGVLRRRSIVQEQVYQAREDEIRRIRENYLRSEFLRFLSQKIDGSLSFMF